MVKIILISMIKNEEKIIERCIKSALPILDAICITDTGSTDNTVNKVNHIIQNLKIPGKVYSDEWKNFCHNRNNSFLNAVSYCKELEWDLDDTFGLLLDADMQLIINKFDKNTLTKNGYTIIQENGYLEYHNTRFVKLSKSWKCIGVTHEYWEGGDTDLISKKLIYIDDIGDGGCKDDKTERDIRLLEEGIKNEPKNIRYYFYLALSYKDNGQFKKAIDFFKKRINMGGWYEEIWYSYYMISKCYLLLDQPEKYEAWALKAFKHRKERAEPIYMLTKYFREKGENFKAYHYYLVGRNIQLINDMLFIEKDVYSGLFEYENTILHYYIYPNEKLKGLQISIDYLNKYSLYDDTVFSNIDFYMPRLLDQGSYFDIEAISPDTDYISTSTSLLKLDDKILANIRFVNYRIQSDGSYLMYEKGVLNGNNKVKTRNAYIYYDLNMKPISELTFMAETISDIPSRDSTILGLEDVRLYKNQNTIFYTATSQNYSYTDSIRIVNGEYDIINKIFINNNCLIPPKETHCEKNWIALEDYFIYKWHPLEIGKVVNNKLKILINIDTPKFFKYYRGSSNVFLYKNDFWIVTHGIKNCTPRKYFHQIVVLDQEYRLKNYTFPFYFDKLAIEYCLGLVILNDIAYMTVSRNDSNPIIVKVNINTITNFFI